MSILIALLCLSLIGPTGQRAAGRQENDEILRSDTPIEHTMAAGETRKCRLSASAGEFVRVIIEYREMVGALTLLTPDGKKAAEAVIASGSFNTNQLSFIAETSGEYRLVVGTVGLLGQGAGTALPADPQTGKGYTLRIAERRAAAAPDRSRVSAERALEEADAFIRRNRAEATRGAIKKYEESLAVWRALGEKQAEAFALFRIGNAYHNLGEPNRAVEIYYQSLAIWRGLSDPRGVAATLSALGWSLQSMGRLEEALSHYTEALPLRRQFDNILAVAQSLTSIGMVYARLGEPQKALEYYEQALPLARTGGDLRQEAFALKNLGWLYAQNGDYRQSAGYAERALQLLREAGDRQGEADALNLSGVSWDHLGESGKAFDFLRQSLAVWREVGNRYGEGQALHNLGVQYSNLFELDLAQDNYLQSLAIWRAIGNKSEEANTLNALGLLFRQNREVDKSRENYEQALAIYRRQGDRRGQALVLNNLGFNRLSERDAAQAHVNFGAALSLAREIGNRETEAISKYGMALARIEQGDNSKAEQDLSDSLRLSRAASFPALETGVLYEMARIAQAAGEYEKSQRLYTETIQAKEAWLTRLSRQTFNVSVFRDQFNVYSDYADLLIRMSRLYPGKGFEAQAFEISERGRARRLLDLLAESNVDVRQGAPADLLDRERSLRWQISAKENLRQQGAGAPRAEAQQAKAELEIHDLIAQYREAQGRIRESSPGYAALTRPTPLRLPEIQKLLDNDTVLLEYLLKKDRSMLWAVTQNSISYFDLPRQGEIETATQRVFELLRAARPSFQPDETPQRKSQRLARVSADYAAASAALSRMLLGPAAAQLGNKRLVIVPDGVLSYLPFNALPAPSAAKAPGAQPAPPLIARHEVVSAPSATVLTVLRQQQQGRAPASKSIAILADPVFSRQDARLAAGLGAVAKPGAGDQNPPPGSPPKSEMARFSPLDRSAIENDFHGFQRLRFSREEAEAIASFAPPDRRLLALDFDANLKTASHETLDQYRIVHFATHGLINAKNPELSGLVLSLYDPEGKEQDGFLRLFEIYNLRLNADLVVMSGCKTALGKEIRGEGLVGLTCGFMYAGAPRVVASLWSVDDQATARLMKRFYQKMLGEGATAAAALRAAQIEMWKEQPRAAPYAWAAFTLQGEWR